ncbi:MAG: Holliday junction resolvase RuvX [Chloroflexota bacterium]
MRLLGLDLGQKRIGLAVTDPGGRMAFPERVLVRRSARADRQAIVRLVGELGVDRIIVGLPLSMKETMEQTTDDAEEGRSNPNAARARAFAAYLGRAVAVPVELWDERMTTIEAEERLRQAGLSPGERRRRIDSAAAAVILEDYLRAQDA